MGERRDVELVRGIARLTCVFCVQVAVPPAQLAQHRQRRQAELLAAEAAGPETAEAACCCHPSHREYPLGRAGTASAAALCASCMLFHRAASLAWRPSGLQAWAHPCGWPGSWSAESCARVVRARRQARCSLRSPLPERLCQQRLDVP